MPQSVGSKEVTVAGTNLFRLAAEHLGDARAWTRIASANRLTDPMIEGPVTLIIPPRAPAVETGGILWPS